MRAIICGDEPVAVGRGPKICLIRGGKRLCRVPRKTADSEPADFKKRLPGLQVGGQSFLHLRAQRRQTVVTHLKRDD